MPIIMVCKSDCIQCENAKKLLKEEDIPFEVKMMDDVPKEERQKFLDGLNEKTFPQIWVRGKHLGGYDRLLAAYEIFGNA